ncbi:uncharacterized protein GGS22DRAFT_131375 [Annulohypoxylon maeteangense]|uniref:uncharacterized protein n=1 Tax=Annulohypoxylon maeteangense TaxID=1927788 RepID=UPI002007BA99|nr:uncharacterized protein GGS22DRAFT_131375 [Annulohypoxylon maeteangense]KAI0885620.1 hypothetical protein GGS22DRAFT_131375 [Annulohypoxylon maeteangense]
MLGKEALGTGRALILTPLASFSFTFLWHSVRKGNGSPATHTSTPTSSLRTSTSSSPQAPTLKIDSAVLSPTSHVDVLCALHIHWLVGWLSWMDFYLVVLGKGHDGNVMIGAL